MRKLLNKTSTLHIKLILIGILIGSLVLMMIDIHASLAAGGEVNFTKQIPIENKILKSYAFIDGAVRNPGEYEITNQTTILDLIKHAGGLLDNADNQALEKLGLGEYIKDQTKINIPFIKPSNAKQHTLININTASLSELDQLPGVGTSTAQKIIDFRPFKSIDDLNNVPGIGDSKFNVLKDLISI